jgi:hypothetical protein
MVKVGELLAIEPVREVLAVDPPDLEELPQPAAASTAAVITARNRPLQPLMLLLPHLTVLSWDETM